MQALFGILIKSLFTIIGRVANTLQEFLECCFALLIQISVDLIKMPDKITTEKDA